MRLSRTATLAILVAVTTACGLGAPSGEEGLKRVPETKDRLSAEQMEHLVAGPMEIVRGESLAAGEAEFAKLIADARSKHGAQSVEAADLLTAFGVELYNDDPDPMSAESAAARRHLKEAVGAYRAAFGPTHPEVALALNSYADLEEKLAPDDPSPLVGALLEQSLEIRERTLGPRNPETNANLTRLANIYSLPLSLKRDPALFSKAVSYYRTAAANASSGPEGDETSNKAAIEMRLANLYARSGNPAAGLVEARRAIEISRHWPAAQTCRLVETPYGEFQRLMNSRGRGYQAEALLPPKGDRACIRMWQPTAWQRVASIVFDVLGVGPS
jgi:hypothetical protein